MNYFGLTERIRINGPPEEMFPNEFASTPLEGRINNINAQRSITY